MKELEPEAVEYIVIHCTAGRADATLEDIRDYHVNVKGWSDVGYHFIVHANGRVQAARPIQYQGAHVNGLNSKSLGVAFVGLFDDAGPTDKAMAALINFVHTLRFTYSVPVDKVIGHREAYAILGQPQRKSCPGKAVDLDALRAVLKAM